MESLMFDPRAQWVVYSISALLCFWAWNKMFFWIKHKDLKSIFSILGAVLLFTPAPFDITQTDLEAGNYAPAFVVILFRKFLEKDAVIIDAVLYMTIALCIGLIVISLWSMLKYLRTKFSSGH
jgi:hypothetical protein